MPEVWKLVLRGNVTQTFTYKLFETETLQSEENLVRFRESIFSRIHYESKNRVYLKFEDTIQLNIHLDLTPPVNNRPLETPKATSSWTYLKHFLSRLSSFFY
jgi:hypothetical protein